MTHRLNIVPVRAYDERCIIVGVVLGTQTRCTIVFATRLQRRAIEGINLLASLRRKCQVKLRRLLVGLEQAQGSLTLCAKLNPIRLTDGLNAGSENRCQPLALWEMWGCFEPNTIEGDPCRQYPIGSAQP